MRYWPSLGAKTLATHSLPDPENERQWSVTDCWSCIVANITEVLCKSTYISVRPHKHMCGNYRNMVANVDASDIRCRCMVRSSLEI